MITEARWMIHHPEDIKEEFKDRSQEGRLLVWKSKESIFFKYGTEDKLQLMENVSIDKEFREGDLYVGIGYQEFLETINEFFESNCVTPFGREGVEGRLYAPLIIDLNLIVLTPEANKEAYKKIRYLGVPSK